MVQTHKNTPIKPGCQYNGAHLHVLQSDVQVWCPGRDSNPQNHDFESRTYANSITRANEVNQKHYKSRDKFCQAVLLVKGFSTA